MQLINQSLRVSLSSANFLKQVIQYGFFADQVPPCFSSAQLASKINTLIPIIDYNNITCSAPVTLSTYKDDITRKLLSLPNIESFLKTVKFMADNWNDIKRYTESCNSLSKITYIHSYESGEFEFINDETIRDAKKSISSFVESIKACIKASLGFKYRLNIDIANCYDTTYTHSVSWAILGKQTAKQYFRTRTPVTASHDYEKADMLDKLIRSQKNNETNGIIIGPYTSRIFSEIILAGLDRELRKCNYVFRRYIDDYKFYFRTEVEANESILKIQRIFNEYNYNINMSKLMIKKFPYEIVSDINELFTLAYSEGQIFSVLNKASELFSNGEKGAYKYAIKFIMNKPVDCNTMREILPILINIMLIDAKYCKYVVKYLCTHKNLLDETEISDIVNRELCNNLDTHQQQEALWFLYLIRELKLVISAESMQKIIKSGDDYSRIIALDIWKNNRKLVKRNSAESRKISLCIDELCNELINETLQGSHWLLLYEISFLDLIDASRLPRPNFNSLFTALLNGRIHFYQKVSTK